MIVFVQKNSAMATMKIYQFKFIKNMTNFDPNTKDSKEYDCPNCSEEKPNYRQSCPHCNYEDKILRIKQN